MPAGRKPRLGWDQADHRIHSSMIRSTRTLIASVINATKVYRIDDPVVTRLGVLAKEIENVRGVLRADARKRLGLSLASEFYDNW